MKFLSYDSKFTQFLVKLYNCCYLNLLWGVCSLPIVTVGAATAALYDVTLRMARGAEPSVTRHFFKAFRENFRQATILWLVMLGLGCLLAFDVAILYQIRGQGSSLLYMAGLAAVILGTVVYVLVLLYLFPLVASVHNSNFAMLRNALLLGIRYLPYSILLLMIHVGMLLAVLILFTPLMLLGAGGCALLGSYLLNRIIQSCASRPEST